MKTTTYETQVMFGDCDPAGIVFFPNFCKWMDASSLDFFMKCGVPPWREVKKTTGIIGTPLLEIHTKFFKPATYGDTLRVHTCIETWAAKTIVQKHVVMKGDVMLCEGRETRAFVIHPDGDPDRLKAIPVPDFIKELCG
jgi:4-hydroxybenzoyl-CoA thioesterase